MNNVWSEPAQWPELRSGEVQVWLADLPVARAHFGDCAAVLSPDERSRAESFRLELHRVRWVLSRGILRRLLARYLGARAAEIELNYNPQGKPSLRGSQAKVLHFNASHSGDHAAFAFTWAGEVGVDIETVRAALPQVEEIARRYFAPGECEQLRALPVAERTRAFFQLWTCKEAFVKARGEGLFSGLNRFEVEIQSARLLSVNSARADDWSMSALPGTPTLAGAVVVAASACWPSFLCWGETAFASSFRG